LKNEEEGWVMKREKEIEENNGRENEVVVWS
jgi:hypothetical protein